MQEIQVKVKCTDKEVSKAISYWLLHFQKWVAARVYFVFPLHIVVASLWVVRIDEVGDVSSVAFWVLCAFIQLCTAYLLPLGNHQKAYSKRKKTVYTFSDEQVETQSKDTRSEYAWAFFAKAHETPAAFLLVDSQEFVHIFPKRCFENEGDLEGFRTLLVCKLDLLSVKKGRGG